MTESPRKRARPRRTYVPPKVLSEVVLMVLSRRDSYDKTRAALQSKYGATVTDDYIKKIRNGKLHPNIHPHIQRKQGKRKALPEHFPEGAYPEPAPPPPRCRNCDNFKTACSFGFPEAISEPQFAEECDFFSWRAP